ncbi:MAG: threonylcarbamoyl-AMP synthase [Nitrospirae bacterium]|nr:threonylcarbamoyl-AMP synthase [Nitrospirota bacterium]
MQGGSKGRVVKIDPSHPDSGPFQNAVRQALGVIQSGGMVAFPTETFYGLGVDPFNPSAVERLFEVKGREPGRPILLVVDDIKRLEDLVKAIPEEARSLIRKFWPGPLTLLFESASHVTSALTGGTGKIGIRIPSHPVALQLLRSVGRPLTATSANPSGQPGSTTAETVAETLGPKLDLILDGGATPGGPGSTIVDATLHPPRLVRDGRVPFRDILGSLGLSSTEDHEW